MKYQKILFLFVFLLLAVCRPCAASTFEEYFRHDNTICYVDMSSLEKVDDTTYEVGVMDYIPADDFRLISLMQLDLAADRSRTVERYQLIDGKPRYEEADNRWQDIEEGQREAYLRDRVKAFLKRRGKL